MAGPLTIGQIQAIADLKDNLSPRLKGLEGKFQAAARVGTVAFGAMAAAGLKAGADWDDARKTIVEGTGAQGEALDRLLERYRNLTGTIPGVAPPEVSAAIADLNTHLGLQGDQLEFVAERALKAGVDTNKFGGLAKQMGLDAEGSAHLLDVLTAAQQKTGVSQDELIDRTGKMSARWIEAGGDMEGLLATVVQAADDFGPAGLRGALSEIGTEVDKGTIPSFRSLDDQLGDVSGTVVETHEAGVTLTERFAAWKDRAIALAGPFGNVAGGIGSVATAVLGMASTPGIMTAVGTAARFMWAAVTGPIGWIVGGIGALTLAWVKWGDEIKGFLAGVWNRFVGAIEKGLNWLRPLASKFGVELPAGLEDFKISMDVAGETTEATSEKLEDAAVSAGTMGTAMVAAGERAEEGAESVEEATARIMRASDDALRAWEDKRDAIGDAVARMLDSPAVQAEYDAIGRLSQESFQAGFLEKQADKWGELRAELPKLALDRPHWEGVAADTMAGVGDTAERVAGDFADRISTAMLHGQSIGQALAAAFQSTIVANVTTKVGGWLGDKLGGILGGALSSKIGGALGGLLGGPIGGILGKIGRSVVGKIGGFFGGLFGRKKRRRPPATPAGITSPAPGPGSAPREAILAAGEVMEAEAPGIGARVTSQIFTPETLAATLETSTRDEAVTSVAKAAGASLGRTMGSEMAAAIRSHVAPVIESLAKEARSEIAGGAQRRAARRSPSGRDIARVAARHAPEIADLEGWY